MMENHICKKCGGIAGWDSYFQSWICTRCGNEELKPITNADRIRIMSDQELAELLWDVWRHKDLFYKECVDGWLVPFYHWLKKGG